MVVVVRMAGGGGGGGGGGRWCHFYIEQQRGQICPDGR